MALKPNQTRSRKVKCRCVTRWLVNFGDDRGEQPVPAVTAALASGVGLPVRLASASTTPLKPMIIPGLHFSGADGRYIEAVCGVCGYPTRICYPVRKKGHP